MVPGVHWVELLGYIGVPRVHWMGSWGALVRFLGCTRWGSRGALDGVPGVPWMGFLGYTGWGSWDTLDGTSADKVS